MHLHVHVEQHGSQCFVETDRHGVLDVHAVLGINNPDGTL